MILDNLLLFTGTAGGTSGGITSGTNTDSPTTGTQNSTNIVDIGLGTSANPAIPSLANGAGARDLGIGDNPSLELLIQVTTAFASGTSLAVALQGAPDNGSGAPGSYTTMWSSAAILEADLDVGAQIANVTVPRVVPGQALPRFLRLVYTTVGTHTAGALTGAIVLDRSDQIQGTDGAMSGYRAGINVAN